jgi:ATP-dependent helicase HepA
LVRAGRTQTEEQGAGDLVVARRADSLLPPMVETVWVGVDNREITDPRLRARLSAKYSPSFGDVRLGLDRWSVVDEFLSGLDWQAWCAEARETALSIVKQRESVLARIDSATRGSTRIGQARVEALRSRQNLRPDAEAALRFEEAAAGRVTAAIQHARLEVDAAGLVILSGTPIEAAGD